jgi:hypothetical protein
MNVDVMVLGRDAAILGMATIATRTDEGRMVPVRPVVSVPITMAGHVTALRAYLPALDWSVALPLLKDVGDVRVGNVVQLTWPNDTMISVVDNRKDADGDAGGR